MFIPANELRYGDVIVEGRKDIVVREVEHVACSKRNTHVNKTDCYDANAVLNVRRHGKGE